MNDFLVY